MTLAIFIGLVFAAAFIGSRFRPDAWYRALHKPSWNPPDWVFGPVWTALYVAIAFAGWLVWRDAGDAWSPAMTFWTAQLILNAAWSWLYFGRHSIGAAMVDSGLMLVAIIGFIVTAREVNPTAAGLFVPSAVWVAFAAVLNAWIWRANRGRALVTRTESS